MPGAKMTVKKTMTAKPATKTTMKKTVVATPATRAKYTDVTKKAAAIKGGPGVKVAPKGTAMGDAQRAKAKEKIGAYKKTHGVFPTPENVKKYGSKY
jgi:hypothetical protein